MLHNTKPSSVHRYADFIQKFQGHEIDLNKEIANFEANDGKGIGKGIKPWLASGIAKKVGPKKYLVQNTDEALQWAEKILAIRRYVYPNQYLQEMKAPEITVQQAIDLLKEKGYKILKPEIQFTEI